jgi:hypothetical protein
MVTSPFMPVQQRPAMPGVFPTATGEAPVIVAGALVNPPPVTSASVKASKKRSTGQREGDKKPRSKRRCMVCVSNKRANATVCKGSGPRGICEFLPKTDAVAVVDAGGDNYELMDGDGPTSPLLSSDVE